MSPDPGTPNDECTVFSRCSIGEGQCYGKETCEDGLLCGSKNCGNFPGNSNTNASCCYDPYRPGKLSCPCSLEIFSSMSHTGEGDQIVFNVDTVLGRQLANTLDWFNEFEVDVRCCNQEGIKKCGGRAPGAVSCRDVCGKGVYTITFKCLTAFFFSDQDSLCL